MAGYTGKQGRKPKPTHLKLLAGNPGKRKLNASEPKPRASIPRCPAHLSPEAKAEWKRMARRLHSLGLLTELDGAALAIYCQAYGRWVAAEQKLTEFGPVIKSPGGMPMQSPFLAIANKAMEQVRSLMTEFGMTPSSRSRINVQLQDDEDDAFEEFLKGKTGRTA